MKEHHYHVQLHWTGNRGAGTADYRAYGREFNVTKPDGATIEGSSDRAFRGDATKYNPEEMLLAALSSCHLLSYLHFCADNKVVVVGYTDSPVGTMKQEPGGCGQFTEVELRPRVKIAPGSDPAAARRLHHNAHECCFIARSVNFEVRVSPVIEQ